MKKGFVVLITALTLFVSCSKNDASTDKLVGGNPVSNNQKATGRSAFDLLSDNQFKSMVIELVYVEGYEPNATTITNFVAFLNERIHKPDGIRVVKRAMASPGKTTFSNQEIIAIEEENRTLYNSATEIAVWAFFVDGESVSSTESSVVLGTAYRNTSFVIYEKTVQKLSGGPFKPSRTLLETAVVEHEFGHILGLTNLGTNLQSNHEDTEHAKHCNVKSCLMYWETVSGSGLISGGTVPKLDAQCLADLKANGGK
ncbi:membrane metalloprotease [Flavobacterium sp. NG2]|uniref:membrane metalloprotease n=1 Tax=Flavobacterium sp. NG2 TaxID=3097547 RepID=UPI002A83CBC1|nr:membrane metalloprotease [Flavobacterium sp. NG2]WPR70825.1 membrane metalloprotease [Flavobacterium sp. NG2]